MSDRNNIGNTLYGYQAALKQDGNSLDSYLTEHYYNKWVSDSLAAALAVRTTYITAIHAFLANEGLLNFDRVSMSPITDPLAHDIEHVPTIYYKGIPYVTTHSMIYSKFLACMNPRVKGIFVDSPNIRLELESADRKQRGKYLIDFSQVDIEVRRNKGIDLDTYINDTKKVTELLQSDMTTAKDLFERLMTFALEEVVKKNSDDLNTLDIAIEIPKKPFPSFHLDEAVAKYGKHEVEAQLGKETDAQFFWITGLMRENYDLVYPYLQKDGKVDLSKVPSSNIFNYDLVGKSIIKSTNKQTKALEILSGAIREWLFEPIIERLLDNRVISERPIIKDGNIENIDKLEGYGPFLTMASKKVNGKPIFPDTFGGGLGVERSLYTMLKGTKIEKVEDITYFGKNPDSQQIYMF